MPPWLSGASKPTRPPRYWYIVDRIRQMSSSPHIYHTLISIMYDNSRVACSFVTMLIAMNYDIITSVKVMNASVRRRCWLIIMPHCPISMNDNEYDNSIGRWWLFWYYSAEPSNEAASAYLLLLVVESTIWRAALPEEVPVAYHYMSWPEWYRSWRALSDIEYRLRERVACLHLSTLPADK